MLITAWTWTSPILKRPERSPLNPEGSASAWTLKSSSQSKSRAKVADAIPNCTVTTNASIIAPRRCQAAAPPPRALGFHQRERAGPSWRRCCRPKREVQSAGHLGGPGAGILPEHDVAAQLSRELPPPPTQGNSSSTGEALSAASEVTRCCTRGRPCGETRRECRAWWGRPCGDRRVVVTKVTGQLMTRMTAECTSG